MTVQRLPGWPIVFSIPGSLALEKCSDLSQVDERSLLSATAIYQSQEGTVRRRFQIWLNMKPEWPIPEDLVAPDMAVEPDAISIIGIDGRPCVKYRSYLEDNRMRLMLLAPLAADIEVLAALETSTGDFEADRMFSLICHSLRRAGTGD